MEHSSIALFTSLVLTLTAVSHAKPSATKQPITFPLLLQGISVTGFKNRSGHWHVFPEHEGRILGSRRSGSATATATSSAGWRTCPACPLAGSPWCGPVRALSNYDPAAAADGVQAPKRALATLSMVISETQRLTPIKEAVEKGWESGDARMAAEHLPYIEHWDAICSEILRAEGNGGVWDGPFTELLRERTGISSLEDAVSVVSLC